MGEMSNNALTQFPAQEEKCWREGKTEITRSQLSQGPRGCSRERRRQDQRNSALETLSHSCHTERERVFMGSLALLLPKVWPQQNPFGSGKNRGDPKMGCERNPNQHKSQGSTRNVVPTEMVTNPALSQCWRVTPVRSWVGSAGLVVLLCASVSPHTRAALLSCGKTIPVFFPVACGS